MLLYAYIRYTSSIWTHPDMNESSLVSLETPALIQVLGAKMAARGQRGMF